MNLGEWIETLEALPHLAPVMFDDGSPVGRLESWRGVYAQLSLPTLRRVTEPLTVADLLADARAAVGGTFTGYKGGDYTMDGSTAVWADDYGTCPGFIPSGVAVDDGRVIVSRTQVPMEYRW